MESLLSDIDSNGLGIFGYKGTMARTPMRDILTISPNTPICVLDIVDCSKQVMESSKKDVRYSAKAILPIMKKLNNDKTELVLLFLMEWPE